MFPIVQCLRCNVEEASLWTRGQLVAAVLEEVDNAIEDCEGEVERLQEIERRQLLESHCGAECSHCHEEGKSCLKLLLHAQCPVLVYTWLESKHAASKCASA